MALHKDFPHSPHAILDPGIRWFPAAGPNADDHWRDYERDRGHSFGEALEGHAARHVFEFDKHHLDVSDIGILLLPAGRSGHIEAGYMAGQGKKVYAVYGAEPERYDVMYRFFEKIFTTPDELLRRLSSE